MRQTGGAKLLAQDHLAKWEGRGESGCHVVERQEGAAEERKGRMRASGLDHGETTIQTEERSAKRPGLFENFSVRKEKSKGTGHCFRWKQVKGT